MIEPSHMRSKMCWHHITVQHQNLDKVAEIPHIGISRVNEVLGTLGDGLLFSVFSDFIDLTIRPGTITLTSFCIQTDYMKASYVLRRRRHLSLVRFSDETRFSRP